MTKLIAAAIVIVCLYVGWELFLYWDKVKNEQEVEEKQAAAAANIIPESLPGLPQPLEQGLQAAQKLGAEGLGNFLKVYGQSIQDPRKAWIELDYCLLLSRENPAEARRIFATVKARTPKTSPVWPRIQKLEKTYE